MAEINLSKYGITGTTEIVHNPSYEKLFEEETKAGLEGYEVGQETELGAVNVMTGIYTGRSPKDKYIVMDNNSKDTVWWTSDEYKNDNHPMTEDTWAVVKDIAKKELCNKRLFVVDAFCGANKDTRMAIRFIVEVAWQAHFCFLPLLQIPLQDGKHCSSTSHDGYGAWDLFESTQQRINTIIITANKIGTRCIKMEYGAPHGKCRIQSGRKPWRLSLIQQNAQWCSCRYSVKC